MYTQKGQPVSSAEQVTMSTGSRADGRAGPEYHRRRMLADKAALLARKKEIEGTLAKYSKANMNLEQQRVRDRYRGQPRASLNAWVKRRGELEAERTALIDEKVRIERDLTHLKPKLQKLSDDVWAAQQEDGVFFQILEELRAIRSLLEQRGA